MNLNPLSGKKENIVSQEDPQYETVIYGQTELGRFRVDEHLLEHGFIFGESLRLRTLQLEADELKQLLALCASKVVIAKLLKLKPPLFTDSAGKAATSNQARYQDENFQWQVLAIDEIWKERKSIKIRDKAFRTLYLLSKVKSPNSESIDLYFHFSDYQGGIIHEGVQHFDSAYGIIFGTTAKEYSRVMDFLKGEGLIEHRSSSPRGTSIRITSKGYIKLEDLDDEGFSIDSFTKSVHPKELDDSPKEGHEYDAFLSHAYADKPHFVDDLQKSLANLGLKVWYDTIELTPGSRIRRSIELGISRSRKAIVVLSPTFFERDWTQQELDGIFQIHTKEAMIIPVYLNIDHASVTAKAPMLSDIQAINANLGPNAVAELIANALKRN